MHLHWMDYYCKYLLITYKPVKLNIYLIIDITLLLVIFLYIPASKVPKPTTRELLHCKYLHYKNETSKTMLATL